MNILFFDNSVSDKYFCLNGGYFKTSGYIDLCSKQCAWNVNKNPRNWISDKKQP
jgi:hypothetical protein